MLPLGRRTMDAGAGLRELRRITEKSVLRGWGRLEELMWRRGKMTALADRVCEFCSAFERVALRLGVLAIFLYGLFDILRRIL
jgi:hypothetical protein